MEQNNQYMSEKIVDTKRLDKIIDHLEGLMCHCQDFANVAIEGEESVWAKDVEVLEETISILTALKCDNKKILQRRIKNDTY